MFFICSRSWQFFSKILIVLVPVFFVPLYQPIFGFVLRLVCGLGGRRFRASIVSLHGSPRAWVYGFGHCWSLQIQLLLVAQSSSISFLLKSLHLADLARKFPIISELLLGRDLRIYWIWYWILAWNLNFHLVRRNQFFLSGGFLIFLFLFDN